MKGFKKDGKFRPTEKRYKPSLSKDNVKSFEDFHADQMKLQAVKQKELLRHKEKLEPDMYECTLCNQQFNKNDPDFDERTRIHQRGMHSRDRVIYSERDGSPSKPMGNHTYGESKFVPEKEKRKDFTIDRYGEPFVIKRYVAFNPSGDDLYDIWTADTIEELVWNLRHLHEVSGTLKKNHDRDGSYYFADLDIHDTKKHPKLVEEMKTWS